MPKKTSAKKASPATPTLDPKQAFVIRSYTREEIADELNNIIASAMDLAHCTPFTPDDHRLTADVCEQFVEAIDNVLYDIDEVVDRTYEAHHELLETM